MATTATQMPETQMPDEKWLHIALPIALSVVRHLTKEYQPEMGVQPSISSPVEFDEKGWRDLVSRALPIATTIARGLLTKEYQPGMGVQPSASSPAAGGDEKWLHIALPIALSVVSALRKDYQPSLA
jgi:hypothetical protein